MDNTPLLGEYSLKIMYDAIRDTKEGLDSHCRTHKTDIDKLYDKIDDNAEEARNDSAEIKQSIALLNQTVSLLAQKIECKPDAPAGRWKVATAGAVALIAGIIEGLQYVKKI